MWTIKIAPINIGEKTARIQATRTEGEDVFTTATDAMLDTDQHKTDALDAIWSDWQRYLTNQTNIATLISDLETAGAANLDARES